MRIKNSVLASFTLVMFSVLILGFSGSPLAFAGGPVSATVSFVQASSSVDEDIGTHIIAVQLHTSGGSLTEDVSVQVVDLLVPSATSGDDYVAIPTHTVTFFEGAIDGDTLDVDLTVIDDGVDEPSETVVLQLQNPTVATIVSPDTHEITINDNDVPPETFIDAMPTDPSNDTTPTFEFSGTDPGSGVASFECSLMDPFVSTIFHPCTSPYTPSWPSLVDETYTFKVFAINFDDTPDPSPASYTWTLDTELPVITLNGDNPQRVVVDTPYTEFGAVVTDNDPAYSEMADIDASEVDITMEGFYTVIYSAPADQAGNFPEDIVRTVRVVAAASLGNFVDPITLVSEDVWSGNIIVGNDGFPVISYEDDGDLKFIHCTSNDCYGSFLPITLDSGVRVGISIALGTDGYPVISYRGASPNVDLKFIHCTSNDCSSTDTPITLDSDGFIANQPSIAIGSEGYPVISYIEEINNGRLKFIHCTSIDCSTTDSPFTLDNNNVVRSSSIAIAIDGYPVISYYDSTDGALKFIHCTSNDCSSRDTLTLDSIMQGSDSSIAIGIDGNPVIAYNEFNPTDLKFIHCTSFDCSSTDTPITLDSEDDVGWSTSIAIGNGAPMISYFDQTNGALNLIRCTTANCSSGPIPQILDSGENIGVRSSIATGSGNIVISYGDFPNDALKFTRCLGCVQFDTIRPVITLIGESNLTIVVDTPYTELGAIVTDNDAAYSEMVIIGGDVVDVTTPMDYVVTYDALADASGNLPVQVTRFVEVISASDAVGNLQAVVESAALPNNVEKSLLGPLKQIQRILTDNNPNNNDAACDKLDEFVENVNDKESSGKIDSVTADDLRDSAQDFLDSIGCI